MLAGVVFRKSPNQNHFINVNLIFESKKDAKPISPKNVTDFKKSTDYFVLWCKCTNKPEYCKKNECQNLFKKFYEAQIFGLGGKFTKDEISQTRFIPVFYIHDYLYCFIFLCSIKSRTGKKKTKLRPQD